MKALLERLELLETTGYAQPTRQATSVEGLLFMPAKRDKKGTLSTRGTESEKDGYAVWHAGGEGGPHLVGTVNLHHTDGFVTRVNGDPMGTPKLGPARNFRDRGSAAKFLAGEFQKALGKSKK